MAAKNLRPVLEGQRLKARKRGASMTLIHVANVLSQSLQHERAVLQAILPLCAPTRGAEVGGGLEWGSV